MEEWIYKQLNKKILLQKENDYQYVFLCIGTEKVIGDLYGPLVGQKLYENDFKSSKFNVIGRIGDNVTYSNIGTQLEKITNNYLNPYIIAIDAAISEEENIGKIVISNSKMKIGKAIKKQEKQIGNISIKAIVGKKNNTGLDNYKELKSISYSFIENLANETVKGILKLEV